AEVEVVVGDGIGCEHRVVLVRRALDRGAALPAAEKKRAEAVGAHALEARALGEAHGLLVHEAQEERHVLPEAAENQEGAVVGPGRAQGGLVSGGQWITTVLTRIADYELTGPDQKLPGLGHVAGQGVARVDEARREVVARRARGEAADPGLGDA